MQVVKWQKIPMDGWNRYEGYSQDYGPYVIEKEDDRAYSIWWGGHDIGDSETVAGAKSIALQHARNL